MDYSVSGFPLLFVALLELVALNWIYGYKRFSDDIKMMLGHKPNIYWKVCWLGLSPAVVGVGDYYNTTTITLNLKLPLLTVGSNIASILMIYCLLTSLHCHH